MVVIIASVWGASQGVSHCARYSSTDLIFRSVCSDVVIRSVLQVKKLEQRKIYNFASYEKPESDNKSTELTVSPKTFHVQMVFVTPPDSQPLRYIAFQNRYHLVSCFRENK